MKESKVFFISKTIPYRFQRYQIPAMPKFSTRRAATFGPKMPGVLGPRWMFLAERQQCQKNNHSFLFVPGNIG